MLSLYNSYKSIILESTEIDVIMDAIHRHYYVNIMYGDKKSRAPNVRRYCQVYNIGKTSQNNNAIRVFQVFGPGERGWKTFDVEYINKLEPTEMFFNKPIGAADGREEYRLDGDDKLGGTKATTTTFDDKELSIFDNLNN